MTVVQKIQDFFIPAVKSVNYENRASCGEYIVTVRFRSRRPRKKVFCADKHADAARIASERYYERMVQRMWRDNAREMYR